LGEYSLKNKKITEQAVCKQYKVNYSGENNKGSINNYGAL